MQMAGERRGAHAQERDEDAKAASGGEADAEADGEGEVHSQLFEKWQASFGGRLRCDPVGVVRVVSNLVPGVALPATATRRRPPPANFWHPCGMRKSQRALGGDPRLRFGLVSTVGGLGSSRGA